VATKHTVVLAQLWHPKLLKSLFKSPPSSHTESLKIFLVVQNLTELSETDKFLSNEEVRKKKAV